MNVLILEQRAEEYKKILAPKFPDVVIHAATREEDVGAFIDKTDALFTIRISDGLLKKAKNLKWIHAFTTGVDYIVNLPSLKKGDHGYLHPRHPWTAGIGNGPASDACLEQELSRSGQKPG